MNISNFLSKKNTIDLILNSDKNSKVLLNNLNKNKGFGIYRFELNSICFDITTYTKATECIIFDRYIENGHDKYLVKHKNSESLIGLRGNDLILK